ncbi:MAG: DOMON-like domain-containing protein [Azonexus sp.]
MNPAHHATLSCHQASPCSAIDCIEIVVHGNAAGGLDLSFRVSGRTEDIQLPLAQPSGPADNLWQHTCCEAFIATVNRKKYQEFNFSPSGQWAAYRFNDYRERDADFVPAAAPLISLQSRPDGFQLDASIAPELLPDEQTLLLGISAVIETADGSKSYWALEHGAPQPDFHLRQSFALTFHRNMP